MIAATFSVATVCLSMVSHHQHFMRRLPSATMCAATTPNKPISAVGVDGGDVWSGVRVTRNELDDVVATACSTTISAPIIAQYYPGRAWLWLQWSGTVIRRVLPREVLFSLVVAVSVSLVFRGPGPQAAMRAKLAESSLAGIAKVWTLSAGMASFTFSFFLSQGYSLWRSVYSLTRRVQGRLNDLGLLCATYAERDAKTGRYTAEAEVLLQTVARYVLFDPLVSAFTRSLAQSRARTHWMH